MEKPLKYRGVAVPEWLDAALVVRELKPGTESQNELRVALINDILKEAFNHE